MKLEELGYTPRLGEYIEQLKYDSFELGRVIAEHKERYLVRNESGEFEAEITGNLRFSAKNREDYPAVGDWVMMSTYEEDFAVIHKILPRTSVIKRQALGQASEEQIIAANVDFAFLVQAVSRDFNLNRLERYLTICLDSNVRPIIVLSKIDLIQASRLKEIIAEIEQRIPDVPVVPISNESHDGYEALQARMQIGKTYCLLGSSGVGKSSLVNNLSEKTIMKTAEISHSNQKGRHITSHRELIVLDNGILIDNPGMREVGITDADKGLTITFDAIYHHAAKCRFKDCSHAYEIGCAVIEAVHKGEINHAAYSNWLKMDRERAHYESNLADRRRKDKEFGKIMKNYKKEMKKESWNNN